MRQHARSMRSNTSASDMRKCGRIQTNLKSNYINHPTFQNQLLFSNDMKSAKN
jgi:hypothetical protein